MEPLTSPGLRLLRFASKDELGKLFDTFHVLKVSHRAKFQLAHLDNWFCNELFVTHGEKAFQSQPGKQL